jgi:hypothetical protein
MELSFEQALIEVWRQTLVENANTVVLGQERYPVRWTPKRRLKQVDFVFEEKRFAIWNRTPRLSPDGRRWHGQARK